MTDVFSQATLARGLNYYKNNCVLSLRLSEGLLKGIVKDATGSIYDVCADLKTWPEHPSTCSCMQGQSCEHTAACLYAIQPKPRDGTDNNQLARPQSQQKMIREIDLDSLDWFSDVKDAGNQFFSYELGIQIDGQSINLLPLVLHLLGKWDGTRLSAWSDDTLVELPFENDKILRVKLGRIKPLIQFLLQFRTRGEVKLKNYQLLLVEELENALASNKSRWHGREILSQKLKQLIEIQSIQPSRCPTGLNAQLRDYQQQGLSWLQTLRESSLAGILADDMGLGKTIQTLAHLQLEKEEGRLKKASLIVAPTSLLWNWFDEAKKFTPGLKVLVFHGANRHDDNFDDYDLIISTYTLVVRDKKRFLAYNFYYFILDEAQFIKNARAKTTQAIQQLHAEHRLCLSGTPIENHLGELWSLFHFLMPGLLGDSTFFKSHFKIPIEKHQDLEKRNLLINRIKPFILRRNKNQVASELPAKTEMTTLVEITGAQRDLYEIIRISMEKKVREAIAMQGMARSHLVFLDALLKLRQVCCDPRLLSMPQANIAYGSSAKLTALMTLVTSLMAEKRRVLIFSQFTSMLELIEEKLKEHQYPYLKLTGQSVNRKALISSFQEGAIPLFLISLKAGGTGLNLTMADTVIHYDPWWNPKVEDQATDRTHRIGQTQPVFVYKLIAAGTVEEAILALQTKKRQLVEGILTDQLQGLNGLNPEDLAQFFNTDPLNF